MAWLHHHCLALHLLVASDTDVAQFLYLFSDGTQLNHGNLPEVATLGLHHFISISHVPRSAWVSLEGGEVPIMRELSKNDYGVTKSHREHQQCPWVQALRTSLVFCELTSV